ncbi:hypothetical protein ED733_007219 [Metarhizium rileyi]|uniref:Uncharacterized protein n=1 Tax=Metarhizium rileyi (strain RCEF 4871) TaxID=1649241 RepID=A0A5C6GG21_METRR|nr:hypothetical protein ED733_007219 [Metarhizium rileyi]
MERVSWSRAECLTRAARQSGFVLLFGAQKPNSRIAHHELPQQNTIVQQTFPSLSDGPPQHMLIVDEGPLVLPQTGHPPEAYRADVYTKLARRTAPPLHLAPIGADRIEILVVSMDFGEFFVLSPEELGWGSPGPKVELGNSATLKLKL